VINLTSSYWLFGASFVFQGLGNALYDVGGNQIILKLWKGISDSPVNAMHAGYGVGALLVVQLVKPFIQFDPQNYEANNASSNSIDLFNSTVNSTSTLDFKLRIPFWISALMGLLISVTFVISQFCEIINKRKYQQRNRFVKITLIKSPEASETQKNPSRSFFKRTLLGEKYHGTAATIYMVCQIFLIAMVMFYLNGYIVIVSKYLLTYITLGPAKLTVETYANIQTLYWTTFIFGRFAAAFIAYKLNPLVFVFSILFLNVVASACLVVPYFSQYEAFYWAVMAVSGLTSGPCIPSMYMAAKHVLRDYNSVVISIFSIGLGAGPLVFNQIAGYVLDKLPKMDHFLGYENFNSKYFIAHLIFIPSFLAFVTLLIIILVYKKFGRLVKK
jgi:FHS family Na+ dependent glucose MFS transporter 1